MGERANIVVRHLGCGDEPVGYVWLYTHWTGYELPRHLQKGLARQQRWDDPPYLTRILFDSLTEGRQGEETGAGISPAMTDNGYNVLLVDPGEQTVSMWSEDSARQMIGTPIASWSFEAFVALELDADNPWKTLGVDEE